MTCMASVASKTLFPLVDGRGQKYGGEKGSGVSVPYSITMWNAIIGIARPCIGYEFTYTYTVPIPGV